MVLLKIVTAFSQVLNTQFFSNFFNIKIQFLIKLLITLMTRSMLPVHYTRLKKSRINSQFWFIYLWWIVNSDLRSFTLYFFYFQVQYKHICVGDRPRLIIRFSKYENLEVYLSESQHHLWTPDNSSSWLLIWYFMTNVLSSHKSY